MMQILDGDAFTMSAPDGWRARRVGDGGTFELSGPGLGTAGANVSVYPRSGPWIGEAEARKLVDLFLKALDLIHRDPVQILPGTPAEELRLLVTCQAREPETGDACDWVVYLVLWRSHVILCSCNDRSPSLVPGRALEHFATIAPSDGRRRRWFGRAR